MNADGWNPMRKFFSFTWEARKPMNWYFVVRSSSEKRVKANWLWEDFLITFMIAFSRSGDWKMSWQCQMEYGVWCIRVCPFKKFYIIVMIDTGRRIQLYSISINNGFLLIKRQQKTLAGSLYMKIMYCLK